MKLVSMFIRFMFQTSLILVKIRTVKKYKLSLILDAKLVFLNWLINFLVVERASR